jgi:hypothetical protein
MTIQTIKKPDLHGFFLYRRYAQSKLVTRRNVFVFTGVVSGEAPCLRHYLRSVIGPPGARMDCFIAVYDYFHVEHTSSRPITEVKQRRVRVVLEWVTAWNYRVL